MDTVLGDSLIDRYNFRDIGGLKAKDGRSVITGRVFRSSDLCCPDENDKEYFRGLGIKRSFDFRSSTEQHARVSLWLELSDSECWCFEGESSSGNFLQTLVGEGGSSDIDSREAIMNAYRRIYVELKPCMQALFHSLALSETKHVYYCTFGKDRTGIVTAILLSALGVSDEDVFEEYLLSKRFYGVSVQIMKSVLSGRYDLEESRHIWQPMMVVERRFIEATFDCIRSEFGSVPNYVRVELGVDLFSLRKQLLF